MKNFILAMIVCVFCSVSFASDCSSGRCRQPVRNVVGAVVGTTVSVAERVVSVPVNVARRVSCNVQHRRYNRRCR